MKINLLGRILVSVIGAAFILWGLCDLTLGIWGEQDTAVITSVRRQGGERDDAMPGRYTYQIAYRFIDADGKQMNGSFTQTGDAPYTKTNGEGSIIIRYFAAASFINAPEINAKPSLRQPVLIGTGAFLLAVGSRSKNMGQGSELE